MDTLFVGRNIIFLPEVESTNSYAINLLKNVNVSEGTLIHTAKQIKGKGQRGNDWQSESEKNITATFILKPSFLSLNKQSVLYQITALAVYDLLAQKIDSGQNDIKIKWPNDVLVNEKKMAGILIENIMSGNKIQNSIIGIGINVNQLVFPKELNATSMVTYCEKEQDLMVLLELLSSFLEKYYLMIKTGKFEEISDLYKSRFFRLGEYCRFSINGAISEKKVIGPGASGLLQLEDRNGIVNEYDVKQIKWIF